MSITAHGGTRGKELRRFPTPLQTLVSCTHPHQTVEMKANPESPETPRNQQIANHPLTAKESRTSNLTFDQDSASRLPSAGRLCGIDFGSVRIGLATCDPSQQWVTPFETYVRRSEKIDAEYFRRLASNEMFVGFVIGLPIHCDGQESQKSHEARRFAKWISATTNLPHALYDERFTSREARHLLQATELSNRKKKQRIDRLAAHLILSHYLEHRRNSSLAAEQQHAPPWRCEALED